MAQEAGRQLRSPAGWRPLAGLLFGICALPPLLGGPRQLANVSIVNAAPNPQSGEERLVDGQFMRVADPRSPGGQAQEGWQQALMQSMASALQDGSQQVVMVFSRQGCPWCREFVPVLRNAIKHHAHAYVNDAAAVTDGVMPLRVFVFDADEFPSLVREFQVEGFPASLVFGVRPGIRPSWASGYLDQEGLESLLRSVALQRPAAPEESEDGPRLSSRGGTILGFLLRTSLLVAGAFLAARFAAEVF